MKEAILYKQISAKRTRCLLCYRNCVIEENNRGFCLSRLNIDGKLYSLNYGVISAIEPTPIEDKPLIGFFPGSRCLSIGTFGCNFRCKGCQNHDLSWGRDVLDELRDQALGISGGSRDTRAADLPDYQLMQPEEIIDRALRAECQGIAFTFNEPTIWAEYVLDTGKLAKENGLYTAYVSNSWLTTEHLDAIAPYIDAMALDIKSMNDTYYSELCDVKAAVKHVLATCAHAMNVNGIHVETRTCIIPGWNDDPEMLSTIAEWIKNNLGVDSIWHILRFFPQHKLQHISPTSAETLDAAKALGEKAGLRRVGIIGDKSCD
ncbi:MAG: radical SAM protein [Planctomycetes bacterium]|nr:radical SAM protein [Planctomycetota bacterium]